MFVLPGCGQDDLEPAPEGYTRTTESRSGLVLYAPRPFQVKALNQDGHAGFTIEYVDRELVAAVFRTNASNVSLGSYADQEVTSEAYARNAQAMLVARLRDEIRQLLPNAKPEGDGWRLMTLEQGVSRDRDGNFGGFGRYALEFGTAFRTRSVDMFGYLAQQVGKMQISDFPPDPSKYHPAGANTIDFIVSFAMQRESGFFTGESSPRLIDVGIAAIPRSKSSAQVLRALDDVLAFKSLGRSNHEFVEETTTFTFSETGPPVDFVLALNNGPEMSQEAPHIIDAFSRWVADMTVDADYDWRVAVITHDSASPLHFADGKTWLGPRSNTPDEQMKTALTTLFANPVGGRNELLQNAVRLVRGDELATFHREGAPLVLFTASDSDNDSLSVETGTSIQNDSEFYKSYAAWLAPYESWVAMQASTTSCSGPLGMESNTAGRLLSGAAVWFGAISHDFCRQTPRAAAVSLARVGAQRGARFRFDVPPPIPFTLSIAVNGAQVPADEARGWEYDLYFDRLLFAPTVLMKDGDTVKATYRTLRPRQR